MTVNPGNRPGFLVAESAALKHRLTNTVAVADDKVEVRALQSFFRHPEKTTEKDYPFITIEMIDIRHARDRQHSEVQYAYASSVGVSPADQHSLTSLWYYPSELDSAGMESEVDDGGFLVTDQFVPVDLVFQVETHARNPLHDLQIHALMLRRVFPFRRGFIEIPEDGTVRRLDLLGFNSSDILDQETGYKKRIFRKVYTVSMSAEIPQADLSKIPRSASVLSSISGHTYSLSNEPFLTEEIT